MSIPVAVPKTEAELLAAIQQLKHERNAVILAHNYERPEIQDLADFTGDSLGLSQRAAETDADVIVFCGVHFMAETAAILSPQKTVLLPDLEAGCSLADTIDADQLRAWKAEHPGAIVVSYINTTAEVKAETDYCCTSSNAVKVVASLPEEKEVLFCPDMFLGSFVEKSTGRKNMHIWMGECHVHAGIRPEQVRQLRQSHPEAEFLIHPECGCSTESLYRMAEGDLPAGTKMVSTSGMIDYAKKSPSETFIVATEVGILHRMRKENPQKTFIPASESAICPFMKKITLDKVYRALAENVHQVTVPDDIADKARLSIERMLAIA